MTQMLSHWPSSIWLITNIEFTVRLFLLNYTNVIFYFKGFIEFCALKPDV